MGLASIIANVLNPISFCMIMLGVVMGTIFGCIPGSVPCNLPDDGNLLRWCFWWSGFRSYVKDTGVLRSGGNLFRRLSNGAKRRGRKSNEHRNLGEFLRRNFQHSVPDGFGIGTGTYGSGIRTVGAVWNCSHGTDTGNGAYERRSGKRVCFSAHRCSDDNGWPVSY